MLPAALATEAITAPFLPLRLLQITTFLLVQVAFFSLVFHFSWPCRFFAQFPFLRCIANTCTSTQVADSDYAAANSIFGTTGLAVAVTCNAGYSGSGTATCSTGGTFNAVSCTGT